MGQMENIRPATPFRPKHSLRRLVALRPCSLGIPVSTLCRQMTPARRNGNRLREAVPTSTDQGHSTSARKHVRRPVSSTSASSLLYARFSSYVTLDVRGDAGILMKLAHCLDGGWLSISDKDRIS